MEPYYEKDGIAIYNGDFLDVMRQIEDNSFDIVVTDPPYFIPAQTNAGTRDKAYRKSLADMSIFRHFCKNIFSELDRITPNTASWYVFCDSQSYPFIYEEAFPFCKYVKTVIWDRAISYNGYTWRRGHEIIAWCERDNAPRIPTGDSDVIKERGVLQKNRNHPAEKPTGVLEKIIGKYQDTDIIIDPFMGSGTTLVAAKKLGRKAVGIELSEKYCDIAVERLKAIKHKLGVE